MAISSASPLVVPTLSVQCGRSKTIVEDGSNNIRDLKKKNIRKTGKKRKLWKKPKIRRAPQQRAHHLPPVCTNNTHIAKIGNINATTIKDDSMLLTSALLVKSLGQIMCAVSETHRTGKETYEDWPEHSGLEGWKLINSGFKKKAYGGVALLMSPEVTLVDDDFEVIEQGRILRAKVKYRGIKLMIHVVYGPTNASKKVPMP